MTDDFEEEIKIEVLGIIEDSNKAPSSIDALMIDMDKNDKTTVVTGEDFVLEFDNETLELINGIGEATSREYEEGEEFVGWI